MEDQCFTEFCKVYEEDSHHRHNIAYSAIKALTNLVQHSTEKTFQGFLSQLDSACDKLAHEVIASNILEGKTVLALKAVCDIYRRIVRQEFSVAQLEDIGIIKEVIIDRSNILAQHTDNAKSRIALYSKMLIRDGLTILVHGQSSVVQEVLVKAAQRGIQFNVIMTESADQLKKSLVDNHIPVKLIQDAAVAIAMASIDCVFVGAEAVVENGGIVNRIGTFTVALCAKTFQKPFYVFTESIKFIKEFPLNQADVNRLISKEEIDLEHVKTDYTPPEYLTLLFTDIGIFTPSAMTDFASKYAFAFDESDDEDFSITTPIQSKPQIISQPIQATVMTWGQEKVNQQKIRSGTTQQHEEEIDFMALLKQPTQPIEKELPQKIQSPLKTQQQEILQDEQVQVQAQEQEFEYPAHQESISEMSNYPTQQIQEEALPAIHDEVPQIQQTQQQSDTSSPRIPQRIESPDKIQERREEQEDKRKDIQAPVQQQSIPIEVAKIQQPLVKQESQPQKNEWLKGKDAHVTKFFQNLLSDSDLSDEDETFDLSKFTKKKESPVKQILPQQVNQTVSSPLKQQEPVKSPEKITEQTPIKYIEEHVQYQIPSQQVANELQQVSYEEQQQQNQQMAELQQQSLSPLNRSPSQNLEEQDIQILEQIEESQQLQEKEEEGEKPENCQQLENKQQNEIDESYSWVQAPEYYQQSNAQQQQYQQQQVSPLKVNSPQQQQQKKEEDVDDNYSWVQKSEYYETQQKQEVEIQQQSKNEKNFDQQQQEQLQQYEQEHPSQELAHNQLEIQSMNHLIYQGQQNINQEIQDQLQVIIAEEQKEEQQCNNQQVQYQQQDVEQTQQQQQQQYSEYQNIEPYQDEQQVMGSDQHYEQLFQFEKQRNLDIQDDQIEQQQLDQSSQQEDGSQFQVIGSDKDTNNPSLIDLDDQVEVKFGQFEDAFEISQIHAINQMQSQQYPTIKEEESISGDVMAIQKVKSLHREMKIHAQFHQVQPRLLTVSSMQQQLQVQQYDLNKDQVLYETLGKLVTIEPSKFNEQAQAKIVQGIERYLQTLDTSSSQKDVWLVLQALINIAQPSNRRNTPFLLQTGNVFFQGQRNMIIEQLCEGKPLSHYVQDLDFKKDIDSPVNINNRSHLENLNLTSAFDHNKGIKYDGFVTELIRRGNWTDSLLFASLFCKPQERDKYLGQYVKQQYSSKNPLYTLLLIMTNQAESLFKDENVQDEVLDNWRIQVAFLLKNLDYLSDKQQVALRFLDQLSNQLLLKKQNLHGYLFLKLLVGNWDLSLLQKSSYNSQRVDLSLNYIQTLMETLVPRDSSYKNRVELSFYRFLIYGKQMGIHEQALEELHYVIENRDKLDPQLVKNQYFQFMIRELKSSTFDYSRNKQILGGSSSTLNVAQAQKPLQQQHQKVEESKTISQVQVPMKTQQSAEKEKQQQATPHQQQQVVEEPRSQKSVNESGGGLMTGFKGLFRRVIDQAQNIGQQTLQEIMKRDDSPENNESPEQQHEDRNARIEAVNTIQQEAQEGNLNKKQQIFSEQRVSENPLEIYQQRPIDLQTQYHQKQVQPELVVLSNSDQNKSQEISIISGESPLKQQQSETPSPDIHQQQPPQINQNVPSPQIPIHQQQQIPPMHHMQQPQRFIPPRLAMARPPPPRMFTQGIRHVPQQLQQQVQQQPIEQLQQQQQELLKAQQESTQKELKHQELEAPLSSSKSNPFAMPFTMQPRIASATGPAGRPRPRQAMYASLLHHQEDSQGQNRVPASNMPPINTPPQQ